MKGIRWCVGCCLLLLIPFANAADKVVVLGLFSNKAMLEVDGKRHMLAAGQSTPEGVKLISADSDKAVVEINGVRQSLALGTQISSTFTTAERPRVSIWPSNQGMYMVNGYIDGYAVNFLVDTGASTIAMNYKQAKRLGIDYLAKGRKNMAETASGIVTAYSVSLDRVSVGGIDLYNVEAMVLEGEQPSSILLGMSFLGQLDMQYEGEALILKQKY